MNKLNQNVNRGVLCLTALFLVLNCDANARCNGKDPINDFDLDAIEMVCPKKQPQQPQEVGGEGEVRAVHSKHSVKKTAKKASKKAALTTAMEYVKEVDEAERLAKSVLAGEKAAKGEIPLIRNNIMQAARAAAYEVAFEEYEDHEKAQKLVDSLKFSKRLKKGNKVGKGEITKVTNNKPKVATLGDIKGKEPDVTVKHVIVHKKPEKAKSSKLQKAKKGLGILGTGVKISTAILGAGLKIVKVIAPLI